MAGEYRPPTIPISFDAKDSSEADIPDGMMLLKV